MPVSATPTTRVTINGISFGGSDPAITYEGGYAVNVEIPANTTDKEVTFLCTIANSALQAIEANGNCTVKTNVAATPAQTLTLLKNKGRVWSSGEPTTSKIFTTDVTKLFVTNPGADAIILKCACGDDVTP